MTLNRDDYSNILKLLEGVEIKGVQSAKYVAVLAHKIENRVATWFDGHESGFDHVASQAAEHTEIIRELSEKHLEDKEAAIAKALASIPEPPVELN